MLVVEYVLSAHGKLCSENGDFAVDDLTTCKEASEELRKSFKETEDLADWPKGCYLFKNGGVFFNHHVHGSKNPNARQICEPKGNSLRCLLTSIRLLI